MSSVTGEASQVAREEALMCVLFGLNSAGILNEDCPQLYQSIRVAQVRANIEQREGF